MEYCHKLAFMSTVRIIIGMERFTDLRTKWRHSARDMAVVTSCEVWRRAVGQSTSCQAALTVVQFEISR